MPNVRIAMLAGAVLGALSAPAVAEPWNQLDFNPVPDPADIVLPMPCDGSIVFLPVTTQETGSADDLLFADQPVWMGWSGARETAFIESEWLDHVAGGLSNGSNRYFLLAKYELTQGQYNAVMKDSCTAPGPDDALAMTGVTWFDAVLFGDRYSRWLLANHPDALPRAISGSAFVRLPTEAEWEFAVRGGLKVSAGERRNERFFSTGKMDDYAWSAGPTSCRGQLQAIGLLDPNPLGFYDVYGNAAEIVLDGFRTNKAGRMSGQLGAMLVKGGSCKSSATDIRSGGRQEVAFYLAELQGQTVRREDIGFRPAISGLAAGDISHAQALSEVWPQLAQIGWVEDSSPTDELRALADETSDLTQRARIDQLSTEVGRSLEREKQFRREALEYIMVSGAVTARRLYGLYSNLQEQWKYTQLQDQWKLGDEYFVDQTESPAAAFEQAKRNAERIREINATNIREFRLAAELYADAFAKASTDYPVDEVVAVGREQAKRMRDRQRDQIGTFVEFFGIQVRDHDRASGWDQWRLILELLATVQQTPVEPPEWFDLVKHE